MIAGIFALTPLEESAASQLHSISNRRDFENFSSSLSELVAIVWKGLGFLFCRFELFAKSFDFIP